MGGDGPDRPSSTKRAHQPVLARSLTYSHSHSKRAARPPAVVLYTTSLRGVRRTHTDCCAARALLRGLRVAVDERDVSMDAAYRAELRSLLPAPKGPASAAPLALPQVFVGGHHVGGAEELRALHEAGELARLLEGAARQDPAFVCAACAGVRFLPCSACGGGRKLFDEAAGQVRRCDHCNENGLSWAVVLIIEPGGSGDGMLPAESRRGFW